ncbi:O-succinylbenzoate synthase [Psychromonas ingrahamii 37]|uniref:o-succinylbenzoate synthase n=1 Tax=Psychromonas ingrahamii (strain DSM 17664 / CCUG 51855 / 37) TaxID=357804 RepID=A1SRE3_PSYIN|nr:o-succinylbenzoate synthase [Psychromonas ingrahamii]ABM02058.1 O-succinylbenzoate synthase [Psychromonas ingrahamii 37]
MQQGINKPIFQQAKLFRYQLPFKIPIVFKGIKLTAREGVILQVQNDKGEFNFAEIAPLPGFSKETLQQATAQIIALLNTPPLNSQSDILLYPSVAFALDCILHNIPISELFKTAESIPLLQGDNHSVLKQYLQLNKPNSVKLKIGRQSVAKDITLFSALSALNNNLLIRCDANQSWTFAQADLFFANINTQLIDYIEEPTASLSDNINLAERYEVQLALDETLQQKQFQYQHHRCFKALILKPTLIGSFERLNYFIKTAKKFHLSVSISSSFESPLGLSQLAFLASQWSKEVDISCGLDTLKFFESAILNKNSDKKLDNKTPINQQVKHLECLWTSN